MRLKIVRAIVIGWALGASGAWAVTDRPTVVAQNYPLAYFAERLAGDAAEIVVPSPPDVDPADWAPGVEDIDRLQGADLILLNGRFYADWVEKASLPRARLLDSTAGFRDALIAEEGAVHRHGPEGEHSHSGDASHTWLDFTLAARQAEAVAEGLKRSGGARPEVVDAALTELTADLRALDQLARMTAGKLDGVLLVASHPIYQYFARAYGVEMHSVHWEYDEPVTPAQWAELDEILAERPEVLFLWEGPPTVEAEEGLASRGVTGVLFDPAYIRRDGDFPAVMKSNLSALDAAAQNRADP